jgi:imidazolonepropionase-like amidohydrolase
MPRPRSFQWSILLAALALLGFVSQGALPDASWQANASSATQASSQTEVSPRKTEARRAAVPSARAQQQCAIAIVGATVIDGNGGPALADGTVLIRNGRFEAVGPRRSVSVPECAQVVNGAGKFLTPGFVDTNVHVGMPGGAIDFARYWDRLSDLAVEGAQLHLKYGVTSIRDSYGVLMPLLEARDRIRRGEVPGARLLVAGNIVGWSGNFSLSFRSRDPESYFEEWVNDQMTMGTGETLGWLSPDSLRAVMNRYIDLGVDFVKIGATAHSHNVPTLVFSQRQLDALVSTIHERGLIAETHATTPEGLHMSLVAGMDLIQHPEVMGVPITDELIEMLGKGNAICSIHGNNHAGRAWQQFLTRTGSGGGRGNTAGDAGRVGRDTTGSELRNWPRPARTEKMWQDSMRTNNPRTLRENAIRIVKSGCTITAATDNAMGTPPEFARDPNAWGARQPGPGTHASIESLVEFGMTPADAIVAATKNGAKAMRMEKDLGTIEAGKIADVVVLDADPLQEISNIRRISMVLMDGRIIDRDRLPLEPVYYRDPPK